MARLGVGSRVAIVCLLSGPHVFMPVEVRASSPCIFAVTETPDPRTGNTEHRFFCTDFHFGTLIVDPQGRLIFRPRPDQADPNGFGTSWFINPFLAGADPAAGVADNVLATDQGIEISLSGEVTRRSAPSYGIWSLHGSISYDAGAQRVFGSGALDIMLDDTLVAVGADLNIDRISSNFLHDVPLQTGGSGDTGDMGQAVARYAPGGDPFVWNPPAMPSHFPLDFSLYLEIEVVGQLNTVDTEALGEGFQIQIARKPTFKLLYTSATDQMIAGFIWDQNQGQNFAADNVGINHLFIQSETSGIDFNLSFEVESTVPDVDLPPTPTATTTSTPTATPSATLAPTATSTAADTNTPTGTFTPTVTPTRTNTPTATITPTPTPTNAETKTPMPTGTPILCVGDCNGDGRVTIDNIIILVHIALGLRPVDDCQAGDVNRDNAITLDELVRAVANALNDCSS